MLDQQTKKEFQNKLPKLQSQLKQQFPSIEERDLQRAKDDPDDFIRAIAQKSGQDESMVERQVQQLVMTGR
jgi:hypothetical protein